MPSQSYVRLLPRYDGRVDTLSESTQSRGRPCTPNLRLDSSSMMSISVRGAWRNSSLQVRMRRRRLVRRGELLSPERFCQKAGISRSCLLYLVQCGELFSVPVGNWRYFPAVLADNSLDRHRLGKLLRPLPVGMTPIAKYFFLVSRRGSLGDKSPVQATRRAKRYRVALRIANAEMDTVVLRMALKAGEHSGAASRFDGHAFLRRMLET